MKIPLPKLKAMIRYFATFTDPKLLGKTKLMKLFYFTDFGHVKKYGSPITYDNYVNLEHGPIPSTILNLINTVENDIDNSNLADTMSIEQKDGSNQKRIVPQEQFKEKDKNYFSPSELEIMQNVCERFVNKTGKFIEEKSHEESAWQMTVELENIPYTLALNDPDCSADIDKEEIEINLKAFGI